MTTAIDEFLPALLRMWRELLDQPEAGQDTDFFYAGGSSILAVQLLQRARDTFGLRIPLDALITASTPQLFAERLAALRDTHS
ncbi:phosphopantetheine-binding protein [Nonomuraea sp. B5E05]|uniref:phosphopantetheine-binding protein n=1 Tax=Nonomuraea sp. B5E05 TaxID=3153569 RepID=UPI0032606AF2